VQVDESGLQDAIAAGNKQRVQRLTEKLKGPRKALANQASKIEQLRVDAGEANEKLSGARADLDALLKLKTKMTSDAEALRKKLASLEPRGLAAQLADFVRSRPLMQFISPREKVQQVVLPEVQTDVAFMKITTIDRCVTCHVNIANKDFTRERVVGYLEEQLATARKAVLPVSATNKPADPVATVAKPGAVAMPEFLHLYAARMTPDLLKKPAQANRIVALAKTVGKGQLVTVRVGNKELDGFVYASADESTRDYVVGAVLRAWIAYGAGEGGKARAAKVESVAGNTRVTAEIREGVEESKYKAPRVVAMKYVEDLSAGMKSALAPGEAKLLMDRYRQELVEQVNVFRRQERLSALDPSPVLLAHPQLALYVDQDSKHPMELMGCTSCHDGSGQETNFVVTAHTARPIWVDQKTGAPVPGELLDTSHLEEHHGQDMSSMMGVVFPHDQLVPTKVSRLHLGPESWEIAIQHVPASSIHPTTAPVHLRKHPPEAPTNPDAAGDTTPLPYVDPVN